MNDKLKPCPFCGSEDVELYREGRWNWVRCREYAAAGGDARTETDAIAAWNTRANLPAEPAQEGET